MNGRDEASAQRSHGWDVWPLDTARTGTRRRRGARPRLPAARRGGAPLRRHPRLRDPADPAPRDRPVAPLRVPRDQHRPPRIRGERRLPGGGREPAPDPGRTLSRPLRPRVRDCRPRLLRDRPARSLQRAGAALVAPAARLAARHRTRPRHSLLHRRDRDRAHPHRVRRPPLARLRGGPRGGRGRGGPRGRPSSGGSRRNGPWTASGHDGGARGRDGRGSGPGRGDPVGAPRPRGHLVRCWSSSDRVGTSSGSRRSSRSRKPFG